MLNRDAILAADDLPKEKITIKAWGGDVFVRTMKAADRDRWEQWVSKNPGVNVRASLAVNTVCDENGNLLFSEADIEALGQKSGAALGQIADVAFKLNRVLSEDVEAMEKNS